MDLYRSPYEAYPFLCDESDDLRCDFELITDGMASLTGLLRAQVEDEDLREELLWICELIYHMNPTLRTFFSVTDEELARLQAAVERLTAECTGRCELFVLTQGCQAACTAHVLRVRAKELVRLRDQCAGRCERFVLTQGCQAACTAHILRVDGKRLVRLIYRHLRQGRQVPPGLLDGANLLSGYFFQLALKLNMLAGVDEIPYQSRNYR